MCPKKKKVKTLHPLKKKKIPKKVLVTENLDIFVQTKYHHHQCFTYNILKYVFYFKMRF